MPLAMPNRQNFQLIRFPFIHFRCSDSQEICPHIGEQGGIIMGDKSPKSNKKQASQKQSKSNEQQKQKNAVEAAKQVPKK